MWLVLTTLLTLVLGAIRAPIEKLRDRLGFDIRWPPFCQWSKKPIEGRLQLGGWSSTRSACQFNDNTTHHDGHQMTKRHTTINQKEVLGMEGGVMMR